MRGSRWMVKSVKRDIFLLRLTRLQPDRAHPCEVAVDRPVAGGGADEDAAAPLGQARDGRRRAEGLALVLQPGAQRVADLHRAAAAALQALAGQQPRQAFVIGRAAVVAV